MDGVEINTETFYVGNVLIGCLFYFCPSQRAGFFSLMQKSEPVAPQTNHGPRLSNCWCVCSCARPVASSPAPLLSRLCCRPDRYRLPDVGTGGDEGAPHGIHGRVGFEHFRRSRRCSITEQLLIERSHCTHLLGRELLTLLSPPRCQTGYVRHGVCRIRLPRMSCF